MNYCKIDDEFKYWIFERWNIFSGCWTVLLSKVSINIVRKFEETNQMREKLENTAALYSEFSETKASLHRVKTPNFPIEA